MKLAELIGRATRPFYSLEFFPPKDSAQIPGFLETAARLKKINPLFASVTYGAGGGSQDNTLGITRQLSEECSYLVMPHLTCVGASRERISAYLAQLRNIGIDNILALRGDPPQTAASGAIPFSWSSGEFQHASELVEYVSAGFPDFGIAVAGYPAPHPESPSIEQDRVHTGRKLMAGADMLITQMFFDVREYVDLVSRLRSMGMDKPVIPGVMPIRSFESLRHVLGLCGANIPARLYIALEEADRKGGEEAVREAGLIFAADQIRRLLAAGAPGIHLYTLNKAETCLRLVEAVGGI
ncbi:MAG: methylenetetrahydrofolate reductase [Deltaproteobacteria bacterium]|nr:methylenetetrahydrofolate reductase [Deltaproteobacteria bacterium]